MTTINLNAPNAREQCIQALKNLPTGCSLGFEIYLDLDFALDRPRIGTVRAEKLDQADEYRYEARVESIFSATTFGVFVEAAVAVDWMLRARETIRQQITDRVKQLFDPRQIRGTSVPLSRVLSEEQLREDFPDSEPRVMSDREVATLEQLRQQPVPAIETGPIPKVPTARWCDIDLTNKRLIARYKEHTFELGFHPGIYEMADGRRIQIRADGTTWQLHEDRPPTELSAAALSATEPPAAPQPETWRDRPPLL